MIDTCSITRLECRRLVLETERGGRREGGRREGGEMREEVYFVIHSRHRGCV